MARYSKTPIGAGFNVNASINAQFDLIDTAVEDTLSRKGDLPNAMEADFDLNTNDLLNGGDVFVGRLFIQGKLILPADLVAPAATVTLSSPEDFGVVGDGTDEVVKMQAFFDSLAATGKAGQADGSKVYQVGSELNVSANTRFNGNGCTIKARTGFTGNNLFVSNAGKFSFSNTKFDGIFLPTLGSVFNGTQIAKGCLWVVDVDETVAGTGSGTKALLTDVIFNNCEFLDQPSSWLYTTNLSNVRLVNNLFSTNADEATANLAGILSLGNKSTFRECVNWKVVNNTFINTLDGSGDGNVKTISFNGSSSALITNNIFERVVPAGEGVAGLHASVFAKECTELAVSNNTIVHPGLAVKYEFNVHNSIISNNTIKDAAEVGILIQGSNEVSVLNNTIDRTGKNGIFVDPHSPTPSVVRDITIQGNTITRCGDMDISTSSFQKSAILVRSVSDLTNTNCKILNNTIIGNPTVDVSKQTYAGILLLSDSELGSKILSPTIKNNNFSGFFIKDVINISSHVEELNVESNRFTDIQTTSPLISDTEAVVAINLKNITIKNNVVDAGVQMQSLFKLVKSTTTMTGNLSVDDNTVNHDFTSNISAISDGVVCTLTGLSFDNNTDTVSGTSAFFVGTNVQASHISCCGNNIKGDATNPFLIDHFGLVATNSFGSFSVCNNYTEGRMQIIFATDASCDGTISIEGNQAGDRVNNGITFVNGATSAITGYIGQNNILAGHPTISHTGTPPTGVSLETDALGGDLAANEVVTGNWKFSGTHINHITGSNPTIWNFSKTLGQTHTIKWTEDGNTNSFFVLQHTAGNDMLWQRFSPAGTFVDTFFKVIGSTGVVTIGESGKVFNLEGFLETGTADLFNSTSGRFKLGAYHMWVDTNGVMRTKSGIASSVEDSYPIGKQELLKVVSTTTHTVLLTDWGKTIECSNAAGCTVTVPPAFPVGFTINFYTSIAAQSVATALGASQAIISRGALTSSNGQHALITLTHVKTNTWLMSGDLA